MKRKATGETRVVSLLTDFGTVDPYVGIMKGVILSIVPSVQLVDLTHQVPPQAVEVGALLLRSAVEHFPDGTVHLAVVDPGVGSTRDAIVVSTECGVLVGPDNGLLEPSADVLGLRGVVRIDPERFGRGPISPTFHGRDVFAPAAGMLAAGRAPEDLGTPVEGLTACAAVHPVIGRDRLEGEVIYVDRFGNLMTNLPMAEMRDERPVSIEIGGKLLPPPVSAYSEVVGGELLAIGNSWGCLEVAVNGGSAAERLRAGRGTPVIVKKAGLS